MTRKEFKKSVWQSVLSLMKKNGLNLNDVKVDRRRETVAVGDSFFAQGESAAELIDGIPDDINDRVWIVYYLDSAGVTLN